MWVTTFHSACGRMPGDAEKLGYAGLHDLRRGRFDPRMIKRVMKSSMSTRRFPPGDQERDLRGQNELIDPRVQTAGRLLLRGHGGGTRALRAKRNGRVQRDGLDDLLVRMVNVLELFPGEGALAAGLPLRAGRRIPGHQPRPVQAASAALRRAPEPDRGRRRDQSIYGFRHADIRNILDFGRTFRREGGQLEQNYRSTQTILSAANAVVENNRDRRSKEALDRPRPGRRGNRGRAALTSMRKPAGWQARSGADWLVEDEGISPLDVAVFYRMNAMTGFSKTRWSGSAPPTG